MPKKLLFYLFLFGTFSAVAQNLHDDSNAASPTNEANTTTGWTGSALLSSDNTDAQSGLFSIRAESNGNNGMMIQYTFDAVVGEDYTISIWAREGDQSNQPAFANWQGLSGFGTTAITGNTWTEYTFNVTATSATPTIRAYTSPWSARTVAGNAVLFDNITILPEGGDTQPPNAITDAAANLITETTLTLSWSDPGDNVGVTDYEVFQDGVSIGLTGGTTSFNVTGLTGGTSYDFTIFALDAAGNVSPVSNNVPVFTDSDNGDSVPPNPITDLAINGNVTSTATSLIWSDPGDNVGVTLYWIYQNGNPREAVASPQTFYNVFGLTPNSNYVFTVFAHDANGNISEVSNEVIVDTPPLPDSEAPSAVTDLVSSNTTSAGTDLTWSASTDNVGVTNYEVFQDGVSIANTGTATTFSVTGLSASTSYDFTVFAEDAAGNVSGVGNTETVLTPSATDTEAPSAVTDLVSSNTTSAGTDLTWSASTDNVGVTNYEVFQDGVSIANTGTATTFSVTGLSASTSYDFTVFAEDAAGNVSGVGNTETVLTPSATDTEAPSAVTDLASSNTTSAGTDLTWSASSDNVGVTNYEVFQDGVSIANTGTATTFGVTGLSASTSYDFTVFAEDAAGNVSGVGNTETVLTPAATDTEAPSAVTDLVSSNTTSAGTDLTWSVSTDNVGVTNYEVFQNGVSIANTGTATTFSVTGLSASTSYDFTVFAEDAAGNVSGVGNTETVLTPAATDTEAPSAVTDLTASGTISTSTGLSWSASTDNVGVTNYEVFQNGVSIANTGTATNFNVTGLTPSTNYDFTVFAEDAAGNVSALGNTESVTTAVGSGIVDYTSENANTATVDWTARDLFADRNIGIGTTDTQGYRLAVAGNVIAEGVKVELQGNWPDFVFDNGYDLPNLDEVRAFIVTYGHLPNIPSAQKVEEEGIDLGDMNAKLLQKIEELTLYMLQQQEQIEALKIEMEELKKN